jgi:transposase
LIPIKKGATGMGRVPVFVGLDYHQSGVQVCVMTRDGQVLTNSRCVNSWERIVQRVSLNGRVVGAAIESCTGAADLAEELVTRAGWPVDLAHPGYVARMKQSPDKSDYSDSRMLADLVRVGYLPRVWLAPKEVRELRQLIRYRQQLVNERRSIKLRVGAVLREQRVYFGSGRAWSRVWLAWLRESDDLSEQGRWIVARHLNRIESLHGEIVEVEARLGQVTKDDPVVERLLSLPGVGPVTAWFLRAEIGRFDRFRTGKQLSRFCGLSPRNASSGTRQADAGLITAANRQLRAVLIQAAHRLARHDRRWSDLALKMREAGKPGSVVAAAIANRWVRWLFHQMQPRQAA